MISDFKKFHNTLFMFIALLQECHYEGLPKNFDVKSVFQIITE